MGLQGDWSQQAWDLSLEMPQPVNTRLIEGDVLYEGVSSSKLGTNYISLKDKIKISLVANLSEQGIQMIGVMSRRAENKT